MRTLFLVCAVGLLSASGFAECPTADLSGDCKVGLADLAIMAIQWTTEGEPLPVLNGMTWVSINDSGAGMKDRDGNPINEGGFNGEMAKYETTNAQFCEFLNAALDSNDITVGVDDTVYGEDGSNGGVDFVDEIYYNLIGPGHTSDGATNGGAARINYNGSSFTVDSGFENHPVTYVSWYGSTAFAGYYGYRLPTEWEWQAVADYDGSYTYGHGAGAINNSLANIIGSLHPYGTTAVGSYGTIHGYGMCDMAGNVWEWTDSIYTDPDSYRYAIRGGGYLNNYDFCTVSIWHVVISYPNYYSYFDIGFRVCR